MNDWIKYIEKVSVVLKQFITSHCTGFERDNYYELLIVTAIVTWKYFPSHFLVLLKATTYWKLAIWNSFNLTDKKFFIS